MMQRALVSSNRLEVEIGAGLCGNTYLERGGPLTTYVVDPVGLECAFDDLRDRAVLPANSR